ncbi:multidrug/spermidine efflux SMR transporter subunit MdtI [Mixta intestinalis]|jgi:spermidine export protein MdtI|uniref:Spermidine export protein MdtI n=1 Tax=Mixta intestinalis TaxID=1615494 RepID=A0A6P1Q100_9GAMM|nr:multidrug/spermidine efflux SMR transporter subunit MdtI [Mixta intestinalis]QHM71525.1 Spermidine export protein MdtI [Mixta intestinalis]
MQPLNIWHIAFLILAVVLEIAANIFLKYSDGFRKKLPGVLSLLLVMGAFSALGQAVKGIDLAVAYALWGGFGVIATLGAGWALFGQRLRPRGWAGLTLLLIGMVMIKLA